jgi:hypothetical protein
MPRRGEGYKIPDRKVQSDWRDVVRHMLNGSCDDIVLSASLYTNHSVSTFHDVDTGEDYRVLREDVDVDGDGRVDKGWGTGIINQNPIRELGINAVHPLADQNTQMEAVLVFRGIGSRTYILAGTHREASNVKRKCQGNDYEVSDVAYGVANTIQPTMQELMSWYDDRGVPFTVIQYHRTLRI